MRYLFFTISFLLFCMTSVNAQVLTVDEIAAVVGDKIVLVSDIENQYNQIRNGGTPDNGNLKCIVLGTNSS